MKQMCWLADMKYIIENPFVICGLLPARQFVSLCKSVGINTSEEQLEKFEKLGIFYPFARVRYPDDMRGFIDIWSQKEHALSWLENGFIWEPSTSPFQEWKTFRKEGNFFDSIISFYSIFQCYPLHDLSQRLKIDVQFEYFVDCGEENRKKLIESILYTSKETILAYQGKKIEIDDSFEQLMFNILKDKAKYKAIAAKICQIISNRYYPETQSDGRSIRLSSALRYRDWNWYEYCRDWNAKAVLDELGLDIDELKSLHMLVALEAKEIDPLENWYELVSFISVDKKKKLKGAALFAQDIYAIEKMLRLFYEEITGDKLPIGEVPPFVDVNEIYGINTAENISDHLEFVTNEFNINPKPCLILVVEGDGEEKQFPRFAKEILGYSFPILGIEVRNLKGVGNFTGKKSKDKYGALEKFIDEYHSRQTIVFIVLDNEGGAKQVMERLIKKPSIISQCRTVTKADLIHLWERSIEFDNFSHEEIANAMSELCNQEYEFTSDEMKKCEEDYDTRRKGNPLEDIFTENVNNTLFNKTKLLELLFDNIISNREKEIIRYDKRPVLELLIKIIKLALSNSQPITRHIRQSYQESGYFGDIVM